MGAHESLGRSAADGLRCGRHCSVLEPDVAHTYRHLPDLSQRDYHLGGRQQAQTGVGSSAAHAASLRMAHGRQREHTVRT